MILPEGIVVAAHPRAVVGDVPILVDVEATEPPPNIETRQQPRDSECAAQRSRVAYFNRPAGRPTGRPAGFFINFGRPKLAEIKNV